MEVQDCDWSNYRRGRLSPATRTGLDWLPRRRDVMRRRGSLSPFRLSGLPLSELAVDVTT